VSALAEDRPGVYRRLDGSGRVLYVGKAKRVRARLMSYFRTRSADDKASEIIGAAENVEWDYAPSEFAAYLAELRQIRRYQPPFNVRMNRVRRAVFVKISGGPAPRVGVGQTVGTDGTRHYGPFGSARRLTAAIRVLNDLLGLRDCALTMPIVYAEQTDLFDGARRAACLRHELGTCLGPCAGFVGERDYRARVGRAVEFLEGRAIAPLDQVVREMTSASDAGRFELATRWRERFEALEWLFGALNRIRAAIDGLSFVYYDPGTFGDDRAYVIRRATVRASAPAPTTPIERDAFQALVGEHAGPEAESGPLPVDAIDEMLLLMSWFRRHPAALRRTQPLSDLTVCPTDLTLSP
jgi:excinuclease ABC subunit C